MSSLLFIWIILNPLAPKSDLHVTSLNKMHTKVYIQQTGHEDTQTYSSRSCYLDLTPSSSD